MSNKPKSIVITKLSYEQSRIIRPYESAKIQAECIIDADTDPKEALRLLKAAVINNLGFPEKECRDMLVAMGAIIKAPLTAKDVGLPEVEIPTTDTKKGADGKDEPIF